MTKPGPIADLAASIVALIFAIRVLAIVSAPPPPALAQGSGLVRQVEPAPVVHRFRGTLTGVQPEEVEQP